MTILYFYIIQYFKFIAVSIHEYSHWIVQVIAWIIYDDVATFPRVEIFPPSIKANNEDNYALTTIGGYSCYKTKYFSKVDQGFLLGFLSPIAPLLSTVYLLYCTYSASHWIPFSYIILCLPTFLPSISDWGRVKDYLGRLFLLWH